MRLLSLLSLLLLLNACHSSKLLELGSATAHKGIEVSQQALHLYDMLDQQAEIDKQQQDEIKILTNPDPAKMKLPDTKREDFSAQLAPRIKAYSNMLKAYKAFALLSDKTHQQQSENAMTALRNAYSDLDKLPNLPQPISQKLPNLTGLLQQSIHAGKVKKHHQILHSLTDLLVELWESDLSTWEEYLDRIYNDYADAISAIGADKYAVKKISDAAASPYAEDAVLIQLYRLKLRKSITAQKNNLKNQLKQFGKTLLELNLAHAELSKLKTNITLIEQSLYTLEQLLKQP